MTLMTETAMAEATTAGAAARARTYETLGILMRFRVFPDEVMGKYLVVDALVPAGLGAPPNRHAGESESFVILEGAVDFMLDGATRRLTAGEDVVVPDGALHAFAAVGPEPARILIMNAPGDMHVRFFTELGRVVPEDTRAPAPLDGPPDVARILAVGREVGMVFPAPGEA